MAKLNEEKITIKVSEIIKDSDIESTILDDDMLASLEAVIQELVGQNRLIEIVKL
jgi:hypothetical protein